MALVATVAVVVAVLVGCGSDQGSAPLDGIDVPDGFEVTELVSGLDGPTRSGRCHDRARPASTAGVSGCTSAFCARCLR